MIIGEIGETLELFMVIGACLLAIWVIVLIQKATGTGTE